MSVASVPRIPIPRAQPLGAQRHEAGAVGLAARLGKELAGWPLPLLAVQSHFSVLEGILPPELWGKALAAFHAARGDHQGPWAALADRNDLLGLPACLKAWRQRVGVAASLLVPEGEGRPEESELLLLAPTRAAYRRLCRLLSWRHEHDEEWRRWQEGDDRATPDCTDLVALADDATWAGRLRDAGAEVWWRSGLRPAAVPAGFTAAAVAGLTHVSPASMAADPILAALRARQAGRAAAPRPRCLCLTDLVLMRQAYAGHEDRLERGGALLARCTYRPGQDGWLQADCGHADPDGELLRRCRIGFERRYAGATGAAGEALRAAATARLARELEVIAGKRFAGYILTVADLAAGRRTCGRGSAASSLVCYLLALTNVDPITSNLLFERFLSPERTDPPDIDIDFPWDERDAVLAAAIATHGTARVAMVATHQYLRRWSAIREVARAYGVASAEITRARTALDHAERFGLASGLGEPWPTVLAAAEAVTGSPHHLGLHCGGIVITAEPVRDLVPVHAAAKQLSFQVMRAAAAGATRVHEAWEDPTVADGALDLPTIAWEKDGAEDLGLVKIDLLGNRGLAVVRDCVAQINAEREAAGRRAGEAPGPLVVDEATWRPQDDPATQDLVARGATMGCFYIESPATRQLQAKVGDGSFDRLVVHSSIIRPAAMRWIDTYIERYKDFKAHGVLRAEWFPHPALAKLLSDSYGVLSYQEDVMLIAQHIAGFDSGGANQLRKALGHFDTGHRLEPLRERFVSGARARGDVPEPVITVLWDMIMSFSGYSFCKAHSASYAMVSFQSAWLKAHHPAHFLACVVANEGGFYRASAYLEEARRLGIAILGPCVLASAYSTRAERAEGAGAIRCGFHLVPGVAKRVAERIVAARRAAPFRSLRDLRARARVGAAVLDVLARAGALDALLPGRNPAQRRWLAASVGLAAPARSGVPQQTTWWPEADPLADPSPPDLPDDHGQDEAVMHLHTLGFLPSAHPITLWPLPPKRVRCREVVAAWKKRCVTVHAMPVTSKEVTAHTKAAPGRQASAASMAFVTFEDETALLETVWFPTAYRAYGVLLASDRPLKLSGVVEVAHGVVTLTVQRAEAVAGGPE